MTPEDQRPVMFEAPGQGAYRITVMGDDPSSNTTALSVSGQSAHVQLAPGHYTAIVESLTSPGMTSRRFAVAATNPGLLRIDLGPNPDQALSSQVSIVRRPSQAVSPPQDVSAAFPDLASQVRRDSLVSLTNRLAARDDRSLSAFVSAANSYVQAFKLNSTPIATPDDLAQAHRFSLGVSADTRPEARGGWKPATIGIERHDAPDGEVRLRLTRLVAPHLMQRHRLTVSVERDVAWRSGLPLFPEGVWLMLRPTLGPNGADMAATMRPVNEQTATLIGSLERALPDEVSGILGAASGFGRPNSPADLNSAAMEALAAKSNDPWAAAAAALLLARTGYSAVAIDWTLNLANRFPWLPDASVAAAWAEVAEPQDSADAAEHRSLERLIRARRWGAPYFAASNALALQMLMTLALGSSKEVRLAAKIERARWARHGRRAVKTGAFLAWELAPNTLRRGLLPKATYRTIVSGQVSTKGINADVAQAAR